jgi:hypothetical protein
MQNFVCEAITNGYMKGRRITSGEIKNKECSALVAKTLLMLVMRCLRVMVGKPEENTLLGKPGNRQGEDIKINHKEVWWEWTGFIWVRIGICGGLS